MDVITSEKYSRQILFAPIGEAGQKRLLESSAVLVGCGALGTTVANLLVRAGLGRLRIVDRDFVEPSNLQRQTLFDEADAREALPKAVAAERKLRAINCGVTVEGVEETCDTVGVLNAAVGVIASIEAAEAMKLLTGNTAALHGRLVSYDVWTGQFQAIRVSRNADCRACARREFSYLE